MSRRVADQIRLVLKEDDGLGRVSMQLSEFLCLSWYLIDDLARLEERFEDWITERSTSHTQRSSESRRALIAGLTKSP